MGDRRSTLCRATWPTPSATSGYRAASASTPCSLRCALVTSTESHEFFTSAPRIRVAPQLQVLPMGWNWALHFCHRVLEGIMAEAQLRSDTALSDHRVSPEVPRQLRDIRVDSEEALHRAVGVAESGGFPVKGVENVAMHGDFTGVRFDGECGRASVTTKRIWRLRFAILELLKLEEFDGVRLMKLIGHYTCVALLRRETLCIISAAYAFVRASGGSSMRISPARSCR